MLREMTLLQQKSIYQTKEFSNRHAVLGTVSYLIVTFIKPGRNSVVRSSYSHQESTPAALDRKHGGPNLVLILLLATEQLDCDYNVP